MTEPDFEHWTEPTAATTTVTFRVWVRSDGSVEVRRERYGLDLWLWERREGLRLRLKRWLSIWPAWRPGGKGTARISEKG